MKLLGKLLNIVWIWSPPLLWAGFIYYMSSQPASALPRHWMLENDKLVHIVVWGVLATTVFRAFYLQWPGHLWIAALSAFIICSAYGAYDEWHQSASTGRITDVYDWYADVAGSAVCLLQAGLLGLWKRKK